MSESNVKKEKQAAIKALNEQIGALSTNLKTRYMGCEDIPPTQQAQAKIDKLKDHFKGIKDIFCSAEEIEKEDVTENQEIMSCFHQLHQTRQRLIEAILRREDTKEKGLDELVDKFNEMTKGMAPGAI